MVEEEAAECLPAEAGAVEAAAAAEVAWRVFGQLEAAVLTDGQASAGRPTQCTYGPVAGCRTFCCFAIEPRRGHCRDAAMVVVQHHAVRKRG